MNIDHGKTHWTEDEQEILRSVVREYMQLHGVTQAAVSRESGVAAATLSQFLSNTYKGSTSEVAKNLGRWLTHKREEAEISSVAPPEPTFTQTKTAVSILNVLRGSQALADMGLVIGRPGVGKTATLRQYKTTTPRVAIVTASPAISSASGMLRKLLESTTGSPRGRGYASKLDLTTQARALYGPGWLIVADEAQHLQVEALEELRAIHDETSAGLVLMGNATVLSRIEGNERNPAFAQLFSRCGVRVVINASDPEDVVAILATMGVETPDVLQIAQAIAAKDGVRQVVKAVRRALMTARGAREDLTPNHLRLAYRQLGGVLPR
ncbi:AAA family ATPase [Phenylobacterium sp.]|jgi:hypothetical protein|uniref:AAA family ATPase n=1 Tax=Phenylobacterium sp. TaxID=1871053 RepID=UPI002F3ED845